jgi:anti-sigma28 factor (negative regulator of flagellin synthesis)
VKRLASGEGFAFPGHFDRAEAGKVKKLFKKIQNGNLSLDRNEIRAKVD